MKPILKWAGGKRQLKKHLLKYIDSKDLENSSYFEPFFGGGYLFFNLSPKRSFINDLNKEIINVYLSIKENPIMLINLLKDHEKFNSEDYFYKIRDLDRPSNSSIKRLTKIEKAARTIYLNKTCYNGLFRVNSKGQFNVPYGKYKKPKILDEENIYQLSYFLNKEHVKITSLDFSIAVKNAKKGDFIYFDPPYDYDNQEGFVNYNKDGFDRKDLIRLKSTCDVLIKKGCIVLVSNNDTSFVRNLFLDNNHENFYSMESLNANRSINSNSNFRKNAKEVLIYGRNKKPKKTNTIPAGE